MSITVIEVDADTCDACGPSVRAFLYVEHPDWASSLAYCAHHGTLFLPRLEQLGAVVIDLRHMVTA